jgi:3-deoxy-7-phosphoheptulonate synthase
VSFNNANPGKDVSSEDLADKLSRIAFSGSRTEFTVKDVVFGTDQIQVFAGPNTVESEEMIIDVARNVKRAGASVLRGGAFKPLTFPHRSPTYRDTGQEGLNWLKTAAAETGILVATEVIDIRQLDAVCEVADFLQIGSRNMQNFPLLVEAAKTQKAIILKRHFGCSMRDWLGAAEYVLEQSNSKVILCERGVTAPHTHKATSRFLLDLQVIPALREITHLPTMVDPSHATFWAPWVAPLSKAAIVAGADTLMVEVHPTPRNAWVDPLQAIGYQEFTDLMSEMDLVAKAVGKQVL